MMRKASFFPVAVVMCFLLGCATSPPPAVLTIEMYDSKAAVAPAAQNPVLPIPDPPAADEPVAPPAPVVASTPAPPVDLPATAAGPAPVAQAPLPVPVDFGFLTPPQPRARAAFALAAPVAPAVGALVTPRTGATNPTLTGAPAAAGGTSAAAQKPKPAASTPVSGGLSAAASGGTTASIPSLPGTSNPVTTSGGRSSAAGSGNTTAGAGQQGSSGAASTGSGGGAQGSAPGTATPSAAAAPGATGGGQGSYGRLREIYARQGDELQIGLDGIGFLFLGFPDAVQQGDGMSFKAKETRNDKTWFTFKALKMGTYDLDFLQQDNTTGKSAKETVRVHVVSDQDFNAAVGQQQGLDAAGSGTVETGDPAFAERLTSLGSYEAAIAELLKGYKDGNPARNDQIASLYMRLGSYDAAAKYYDKNLAPQNAYTQSAVLGLVKVAVAQKDQQGLMSVLKQFLAINDPSMEEPLISAARLEKSNGEAGVGLDLAAEYARRFPTGTWIDEAEFLMAQLLEADSQFRDLARARALYRDILTTYPESRFADDARQRLLYIESHFFQVR